VQGGTRDQGHLEEELTNAAVGSGLAITMGTVGRLPDWALALAGQVPGYTFAACDVFHGRAVAAVRMTPGSGPRVITSAEPEVRAALGLPATACRDVPSPSGAGHSTRWLSPVPVLQANRGAAWLAANAYVVTSPSWYLREHA
jgi:hypothetical protein